MGVFKQLFAVWCLFLLIPALSGGPQSFDCPMRMLALEFAQNMQPWLSTSQLQEIADALNGAPEAQHCNITLSKELLKTANKNAVHQAPFWNDLIKPNNHPNTVTIYVDYINGNDNNDGSMNKPIQYVNTAFIKLRKIYGKRYKNLFKRIILRKGTHYLQDTLYFNENDSNMLITNYNNEHVTISAGLPLNCTWSIYKNGTNGLNYYQCKVPTNSNITKIHGLRVNGKRGIRSRYPNGDPEYYPCGFCSTIQPTGWLPTNLPHNPNTFINPSQPFRNTSSSWQKYQLGIGGNCDNFVPNGGFWCTPGYQVPSGLTYTKKLLPNTPYSNPMGGIVQTFQSGHWSSWMFPISQYLPDNMTIKFGKGGYQGGRGSSSGSQFFIENVFEELDYPGEFFYNETTRILYFYNNYTNGINNIKFEVTNLKVILNYTGKSMSNPVRNVEIRGLTLKDTDYTYLDPHGMPSGGDWGLERIGAIYLDNTEDIMITTNLLTRLDGNAISINRYNRNVTIYKNEIAWTGDSVITLWGDTMNVTEPLLNDTNDWQLTSMGYDGTTGIQPRMINISQNYVHELGISEKQSSFYFQAKSCSNYVFGNIFFNGPRAGINFNDGFGGNTTLKKNLVFNCVRETGDHGPFNSWDRQVYLTKVRNGSPSSIKQYDYISQNFIISNYNSGWTIDNDDGSCYYKIFNNFLIYAGHAMKSGHGGHDILHFGNIDAYHSTCMDNEDDQYTGHNNGYYNNSCIIGGTPSQYINFKCSNSQNTWPIIGNNTVYIDGTNASITGICGLNEKGFQQKYNDDLGTVIISGPINDDDIIQNAKKLLWQ